MKIKLIATYLLLTFICFSIQSNAQVCSAVSASTFPRNPQTGMYNYYGVTVSIGAPYKNDITVSGYVYPQDRYDETHPYTLTIPAGQTSASTADDFYQMGLASEPEASIESVSECPTSASPVAHLYGLTSLTSQTVKDKITANYFSNGNNLNPSVTYDLSNMQLGTYDNTDIQGAIIKEVNFSPNSIHNHVAVIYTKGDLVSDMAMEVLVNTLADGTTVCTIYDAVDSTIGNVNIDPNGYMSVSYNTNYVPPLTTLRRETLLGYDPFNSVAMHGPNAGTGGLFGRYDNENNMLFRSGWWKRWAQCVANGLNSFVSGNPGSTAVGLVCIWQGAACATGAAVGCAAAATFQ